MAFDSFSSSEQSYARNPFQKVGPARVGNDGTDSQDLIFIYATTLMIIGTGPHLSFKKKPILGIDFLAR
jgi:hypothetical protein